MKHLFLIIVCAAAILAGCKDEKKQEEQTPTDTQVTEPQKVDSVALAKPKLLDILNRYYADIGAEKIDENQYFAPTVKEFYAMKDQPATKIGESLRQGFQTTDNKKVTINPESVEIHLVAEGYEVIFAGTSEHTDAKKKTQVKGDFHNRVVFNRDMKMIAYNKYEDNTRGTEAMTEQNFAQNALLALGNQSALNELIDDNMGVICISRKGAFDHIDVYKDAKVMAGKDKVVMEVLKGLKCSDLQMKEIPKFDCDKDFREKGCFLAPISGFHEATETARALNETKEPTVTSTARQASEYANIESFVTHQLVITDKHLLLGIGKIEGKWCILVIDTAKYDCSA